MKYLSVCSGIEAATVAWHGLGWKAAGFAEIEKFPSAVLKERFPDVTNYGDMTKFKEWKNVGTVDLLVGGTPCQSFSFAGLRKGLTDPRGNLMLTFGAIASHFKARWIVWENVPGVLSSNRGRDFGAFLAMLAECGYGFAYRVLDAQFFGVPQRRRRVFVVGCLGNWLAPAKVLFDSESLSGNPPPSREKGKGIAGYAQNSTGKTDRIISIGIDEECNATINGMGALLRGGQGGTRQAACLMDQGGSVMSIEEEKAGTLLAHRNNPVVCYENHAQDSRIKDCGELSPSISAKAGTGGGNLPLVMAIAGNIIGRKLENGGNGKGFQEDVSYTLTGTDVHGVFVSNRPKFWNGNDYAECLTAKGADDRMPDKGRLPCVIEPALHGVFSSGAGSSRSIAFSETTSPTLKTTHHPSVHLGSQVRRLTPKECERLQGFPDDWTRISWRGKLPDYCPDGPRYKACGNSMAVPVMRWIGERINKQEKEQK